jgi:hypothetical protein
MRARGGGVTGPGDCSASGLSIRARVSAAASATARQDGPSSARSPRRPFCSVCMASDQRPCPLAWIVTRATSPPGLSGPTDASRRTVSRRARASGHSEGASSESSMGCASARSGESWSEGGASPASCPETRLTHDRHRINALRHGTERRTGAMIAPGYLTPIVCPGSLGVAGARPARATTAPRPSEGHQSVKNAYE